MIQYRFPNDSPSPAEHRWAIYNGKIGGCYIGLDSAHNIGWSKKILNDYILKGTIVQCLDDEFLYIDIFNEYFGIKSEVKSLSTTSQKQCDCDFNLILQKGCQCGGY